MQRKKTLVIDSSYIKRSRRIIVSKFLGKRATMQTMLVLKKGSLGVMIIEMEYTCVSGPLGLERQQIQFNQRTPTALEGPPYSGRRIVSELV